MSTVKGKKYWAVMHKDKRIILNTNNTIEEATERTDKTWCYVVELTVTRVYEKNLQIIEIEKDLG